MRTRKREGKEEEKSGKPSRFSGHRHGTAVATIAALPHGNTNAEGSRVAASTPALQRNP